MVNQNYNPLNSFLPIVDKQGRPTAGFLQIWQQQLQINAKAQNPISTAAQVSAFLDLIGASPGVLLTRGTSSWQAITSPGDATKFLVGTTPPSFGSVHDSDLSLSDILTNNVSITKHGFAPKAPNDATKYLDGTGAWSTPAGGGGGSGAAIKSWLWSNYTSASTSGFATKGIFFTLIEAQKVDRIAFRGAFVTGETIKVGIYTLSGSTIASVLAYVSATVTNDGAERAYITTLPSTVTLPANTPVVVALTRTDSTGTTAVHLDGGMSFISPVPLLNPFGYCTMTSTAPAVGNSFSLTTSTSPYAVSVEFTT